MKRSPVRKRRTGPARRGTVRDVAYLRWVRGLSCAICGLTRGIEAAHVGERGLGQKCSDRETLPLCAEHHRLGMDSHHVLGRGFWTHWAISRILVIAKYQCRFRQEHLEVKW